MLHVLLALAAASPDDDPPFAEPTPALIERCIENAIATKTVTFQQAKIRYICDDRVAQPFWDHLVALNTAHFEQHAGSDGWWDSREFPMGGCFKQTRQEDGSAGTGLSCTVWILRIDVDAAAPEQPDTNMTDPASPPAPPA